MARPDRQKDDGGAWLSDHERRIAGLERREAFLNTRRIIANAGGLPAIPVDIAVPDASGYYSVTNPTYGICVQFVAPAYPSLWVLLATNGASGDFGAELYYPHDSSRVLGTSVYLETHVNLGPVHRVAFTEDAVLAAAIGNGIYNTTISLAAKTANSAVTNKFRIIAAGWGSANV